MSAYAPALALAACAAVMALAACAPPARDVPPLIDLRVCVETEAEIELYRRHFRAASAAEPRGGRECDFTARGTALHAGKVTLRSAYDGSILAEIEGPVDLAPALAAISLKPGTEARGRVAKQRAAFKAPH